MAVTHIGDVLAYHQRYRLLLAAFVSNDIACDGGADFRRQIKIAAHVADDEQFLRPDSPERNHDLRRHTGSFRRRARRCRLRRNS